MSIQIRNPHSVLAALETRPKDVLQINVPPALLDGKKGNSEDDAWAKVVKLAREKGVQVGSGKPKAPQDQRGKPQKPQEGGRVGAAEATVREKPAVSAEELFANASSRAGGNGLWIALDSLQDPHNLGAIFRTAAFFGVQGILMTQERSAPLTGSAYDVASGGVEYVPYTQQINLQRAFEVAKESGLWILGTSEHAREDIATVQKDRPWLLVLGNEESGMRRLTEEACDVLCRVSPKGKTTSLNVSVAAGIFISKLA